MKSSARARASCSCSCSCSCLDNVFARIAAIPHQRSSTASGGARSNSAPARASASANSASSCAHSSGDASARAARIAGPERWIFVVAAVIHPVSALTADPRRTTHPGVGRRSWRAYKASRKRIRLRDPGISNPRERTGPGHPPFSRVLSHPVAIVYQVDTTGALDDPDGARRRAIETELRRVEESAKYSAQVQFEQAKQWKSVNLTLGVPASVLAAVSGATALAATAGRVAAGVLALASAAFGGVLTTLNASHRINQAASAANGINQAASAANAYLEIQTAARQAREIDLPGSDLDEARSALAELAARRDEQNKTAEVPNRRAYRKAKKNIDAGGQTYEADA